MIPLIISDRKITELLFEVMKGKRSQTELVGKLRDYRRFKDALSEIEKLELEVRIMLGFYNPKKLPIKIITSSFSENNGKHVKFFEKMAYIEIVHIDLTRGKSFLKINEEALENGS